jgi:Flp pilus assembly protein TadG
VAIRKQINPRRGLAAIEFALVSVILFPLTFGAMEYGWMFLKAQQVSNAARQGARVGARPDATAGNITTAVAGAMTAANMNGSGYTVQVTPSDPTTLTPGQQLTVRVQVAYANIKLLGIPLIPVPTNLTTSVTMAREGP